MKEVEIKPNNLTNLPQTPYSKGGDIFMAEPGQGERPMGVGEATRRLEQASRQGEARMQAAARRALEQHDLPVDVRGPLEDVVREGATLASSSAPDQGGGTLPPQPAEAGVPPGGGPPAPPVGGSEDQSQESRNGSQGEETRGVGAGGGGDIDKTGITEPQILNYIDRINELIAAGEPPREILSSGLKAIMGIEGVNEQQKNEALNRVQEALTNAPEPRREGLYGERKLTASEKRQIVSATKAEDLEKLFNRMFDRVDARPQAEFSEAFGNAGTFEFEEFMKTLNEEITANNEKGNVPRARELNLIVQQFANEKKAREIIHNAYYGVLAGLDTEKVSNFIDTFQSGWADMAFSKGGVTQAMHFHEQALLMVREGAGGYLKPAEVVGEMKTNSEGKVNEIARELLNKANASGLLIVDEKGNPILDELGKPRQLEPWQIDRALAFARGMSIVLGNTIETAASSILPPGPTAFSDQYAQRIIAELAPFRHAYKFYAGSKFSRVLAYTMNRGRKPWTTKDIEDYANLKFEEQINVLNAMVPEGKERFYSVLNPLEIGGILSRTGWRIAGGGVTMINDLVSGVGGNPDEAWIGTGVQIERKRGDLAKGKSKKPKEIKEFNDAKKAVMSQLEAIAEKTPLRLFLKIRSVQDKVLTQIAEENATTLKKLREIMAKPKEELRTDEDKKIGGIVDELQNEMRELVLLQEKANQAKQPLDIFINEASSGTQDFVKRIKDVWGTKGVWGKGEKQRFFETLRDKEWKTPYTFGTDDVPYNQYSFETTGMRSIARRWGDMASAARGSKALNELVASGIEHFSSQEQIVEAMRKVYDGIKGYNEDDAKKFTLKLAEGIIKFYEKDYRHRLPFGIGSLMGLVTGKSSYAQIAYGRGAMAWEELQVNEFTRLLRTNGMLTVEQQHELQNRAGGGKKEASWAYVRTVVPLLMLALAYYMLSKSLSEKN